MLPLPFATPGEESVIKKIGGSAEVKQHLADLGFVVGGTVTIINTLGGNVIVKVKESESAQSRPVKVFFTKISPAPETE